jgi:hypothetical protein
VDLTLREGVDLKQAIQTAKEIDQQSKSSGFNQEALDHKARQGYANAVFEMDSGDGLDVIEELYPSEEGSEDAQQKKTTNLNLQNELQRSVQTLN